MGKKILLGFGILIGIIILLGLGFFIYLKLNSGDIAKIDDSALYPSAEILSKEDNAFYDYEKAVNEMVIAQGEEQLITDLADGENWNSVKAAQIVKNNESAIADFNKGSRKKGVQLPELQVNIKTYSANTTVSSLADIRKLAKLSSIKSRLLFEQGKEKEAFDNTLSILYAGQKMESSPRTHIISFLIGMAIKRVGIVNMQTMIPKSHLSSNEPKDYIAKIEKFKENKAGLQEAFRMEYMMVNNTKEQMIDKYMSTISLEQSADNFAKIYDGSIPKRIFLLQAGFYYKPNETQKLFIDAYNNNLGNSLKNCNELLPQTQKLDVSIVKVLFMENAIGKIIGNVSGRSLYSVFNKRCQEEFSVIQTQIMLAAQAYKVDNGNYPASLSQLHPKYLNIVYKQFNGKDIIYDAKTGAVSLSQQ